MAVRKQAATQDPPPTEVEAAFTEEAQQQAPPAEGITIPAEPDPPAQNGEAKTFTTEDIEKARREEKDKLYGRLQTMEEELKAMRAEREKRAEAERKAQEKAEAEEAKRQEEAKKKAEEEMSLKDLLAQKESEWESRFKSVQEEQERDRELLAKERRYNELVSYRQRRIEEEANDIMPELRDMVVLGNSEQEIEASLAGLKDRTARILEQLTAAQSQARQQMRGPTVTAPPVGPLESEQSYQTLSNDDLKNMDIATYARNRERLLGAVSQQVRQRGPYG